MQEFFTSPARAVVFEIMGRRAFFYSLVDVAEVFGIAPQTAYNKALAGTFPVKNSKLGGRRVVALDDLAGVLSGESVALSPPQAVQAQNKRRGRPRKADQLVRAAKGG